MKKRIYKILGVALTVALLGSLMVGAVPASADILDWEKYTIPKEGKSGDYVLYDGSDVGPIAIASDGTIYASELNVTDDCDLFKSTDGGHTWEALTEAFDDDNEVVDIVISPVDDEDIFAATTDTVYKSTDGGEDWKKKATGYAGTITSLDVTYFNNNYILVIGTTDDVYIFDESETFPDWVDQEIGDDVGVDYFNLTYASVSVDVLDVALSPNFEEDRQIVAVVYDITNGGVVVTTMLEGGSWGGDIGDSDHNTSTGAVDPIPVVPATTASIVFPDDYDSDPEVGPYVQFVGIGSNGADADAGVYMIDGVELSAGNSVVTEMDVDQDIQSLDISGDASSATILAGLETSSCVRYSSDGGVDWDEAHKSPTGDDTTYVVLDGDMAYAGTSGAESAFSVSSNGGDTFNQTGLVDTTNVAIRLYMSDILLTSTSATPGAGTHSLWKTTDDGESWERILTQGLDIVQSPTVTNPVDVIGTFILGAGNTWIREAGGGGYIWKSDDGGETWSRLKSAVGGAMGSWKIISETDIIVGVGDNLYRSKNGGISWGTPVDTDATNIVNIVTSPNYAEDEIIVVGGAGCSDVMISYDDGETWEPVDEDEAMPSGWPAFDPDFANPERDGYNTLYAVKAFAVDADGIYRYVFDESTKWEAIDANFPTNTMCTGLLVLPMSADPDPDGTLYVTTQHGGTAAAGLRRAVYPTDRGDYSNGIAPDYPVDIENITGGGNMVLIPKYTADGWQLFNWTGAVMYTYTDSVFKPVVLKSPEDGATSSRLDSSLVSWDEALGAEGYQVQWDEDVSFKVVPQSAYPELTSYRISDLEDGVKYYWRVRVGSQTGTTDTGDPIWSPWSYGWEFTTQMGQAQWNPFQGPVPEAPYEGATNVPIKPTFAWNAADWATGYEFILADNSAFTSPATSKTGANALTTTAYGSEADLAYSTVYYWKVRATSATTQSEWATGIFTTEAAPPEAPPPPPPPPEPTTPGYIWTIIGIGAVLVIALIVLIVRTRRVT